MFGSVMSFEQAAVVSSVAPSPRAANREIEKRIVASAIPADARRTGEGGPGGGEGVVEGPHRRGRGAVGVDDRRAAELPVQVDGGEEGGGSRGGPDTVAGALVAPAAEVVPLSRHRGTERR